MKQAVILSGGLGTRLAHVLGDKPKPLALVQGKPVVCHVLDRMAACGVAQVTLAVSYKADDIIECLGDDYKGIQLNYSIESSPMGTGGGLIKALQNITAPFFICCNADTITNVRYEYLFNKAKAFDRSMIVVKRSKDVCRYGAVQYNSSFQVRAFDCTAETFGTESLTAGISLGTYVFRTSDLFDFQDSSTPLSLEKQVLPSIAKTYTLNVFEYDGFFIDVGVPADFERAQKERDVCYII